MTQKTILVIDDDPKVCALLRRALETENFRVCEAHDAASTLACLSECRPDLLTLDLDLGGEDGRDLARRIRRDLSVPIIMISGKGDVIDRIVGLELGADDYIAKPFHVREVLARVRALLRRSETRAAPPEDDGRPGGLADLDGLGLALDRMEVRDRDGRACEMTTADIKLLRAFVENPLRALSRDRLMDLTNGAEWTPTDRTIDNQVARLRRKIERDPARPELIRTVRGVGYMLTVRPKPAALQD